ncbi:MAG: DUF3316 domain-containing protein [Muribaculaceae bacterium]|nr:DUF3316 domain-containing protein [Muribaculaceae bacterium]
MKRILTLTVAAALSASATMGQTVAQEAERPLRPVLSAFTVEAGTSHLADTYLSPLHYSGWHTSLLYERMQAMAFAPERWVMQLDFRATADCAKNPARNANLWNFDLEGRWTMMRRWQNPFDVDRLTLAVGPGVALRGGALYLPRNGNNPAAAKGSLTADVRGMASYSMRIGRLPVVLRYEAALPTLGAFFSPDYGQLYYEIWLGDHGSLCHPAWWGNYFSLDNLLTADLRLGGTTIRVGYHNQVFSTKVDNIVTRRVTHAFTVGIATEWISLSASQHKRNRADARIVSALY